MNLDRWEVGAIMLTGATGATFVVIGLLALTGAAIPPTLTDASRVLLGSLLLYLGAKGASNGGLHP